ncbi:cytochrome c oxidase subunit 3 [Blastococcus montanus]|uniref:cytochrome c oxidase subunit 3 n=1 Tax=Blastococcus montanus TaxID=3144973 RepID=UPI00320B4865
MRSSGAAGDTAPRPAPYIARGTGWWGMLMTLFVLISMLAALLFAYFYLLAGFDSWPPPSSEEPALGLTSIASGLLVLSVVPVAAAHLAARAGTAGGRLPAALAATLLLGGAFLLLQFADYGANDIDPARDVYGSLWLALAGFHHINAALALVGIGVVVLRVRTGRLTPREQEMTVTAAHYWYFVVGSWLVIAATLYLTPRLW